jgi:DivIVA domain-containing protein
MDLSPKTLREVEFREKMRGYHPEDVDQFLEEVAAGLEVLQDRLRQAVERAQRAEAAASESGNTDETLRRTLVLAQRTADLAVQEAREQAARILAGAEQQAQATITEAESRARQAEEDAMADVRAELGRLENARQSAEGEVENIRRWVEDHRVTLTSALKDALGMLEGVHLNSPPPASKPVDPPGSARTEEPAATRAPLPPPLPADEQAHPPGPPTMTWSPIDDTGENRAEPHIPPRRTPPEGMRGDRAETALGQGAESAPSQPPVGGGSSSPEDQALDDFFDDDPYAVERGFGARLRRRR